MSSAQDRNLPATAHRLDQARKDGEASRSRDLSNLAVLGAGSAAAYLLTGPVVDRLKQLGRVARLEVQRRQSTAEGSGAPIPGGRVERKDTRLMLSI